MIDYEIHALADMLGPGQHTGLACPKCRHTTDRALSVLVDPPIIKAVCHRASCGFKYTTGHAARVDVVRPSRARPYTGELHSLDTADIQWFGQRFHLNEANLRAIRKSLGRYYLPIVGPDGTRRGWVSRRPWEGSPLYEDGPFGGFTHESHPKSLTYMDNEEPVQSWNGHPHVSPVVAVEDQISALRVTQDTALRSVALLGTGVNEEKIAELQRHTYHLVIALDSDATGQAFSHARKWGQAFESCRVIILRRDIKDETVQGVREIFSQVAFT